MEIPPPMHSADIKEVKPSEDHIELITAVVGMALTALGGGYFYSTNMVSKTALIPAYFGAPVAVGGILTYVTKNNDLKGIVAHLAVLVTLFGTLAGLGMGAMGLMKGKNGNAVYEQLAMGGLCSLHVFASVAHFRENQKRKKHARALKAAKAS